MSPSSCATSGGSLSLQEMGAATLDEVIESREDLAEYLEQQAPLTAGEKQALLERDH